MVFCPASEAIASFSSIFVIDCQPLLPDPVHFLWCNGGHGLHQCGLQQWPVVPDPKAQIRKVRISKHHLA
jgi:hypothetical protein